MVGLFIKDFELGTKVSAKLTELNSKFAFYENYLDISKKVGIVILDLDDEKTGNEFFIHQMTINRSDLQIIGFMNQVFKNNHDKYKAAGCSVILPKSSLVKNLSTFIY